MKEQSLRSELRKWLATIFLNWAFSILPNGEFKTRFSVFLQRNIMEL